MKLNPFEAKKLEDDPLGRVTKLKITNPIIYNELSANNFSDDLLDTLLLCATTNNIGSILYNHLQSTPNLLSLGFKPEQIASIIYKYRAEDVLETVKKNFSRLNKYYTIDQIAEIAALPGAVQIINALCSKHFTMLKKIKITIEQIYNLANRTSGSHFIIALSLNIEAILATKAISTDELYDSVAKLKIKADLESYFKELCSLLKINYVPENIESKMSSGSPLLDEHIAHINKIQKIESPVLSDEQKTFAAVYNSLIGFGFLPDQLAAIKKYDNGVNCMMLISKNINNFKNKQGITPNMLFQLASFEGSEESIKTLCSTTFDALLGLGYSTFLIAKLVLRPFGFRYMAVIEKYGSGFIQSVPIAEPDKVLRLANQSGTPELFDREMSKILGECKNITMRIYRPSLKAPISSVSGNQITDATKTAQNLNDAGDRSKPDDNEAPTSLKINAISNLDSVKCDAVVEHIPRFN